MSHNAFIALADAQPLRQVPLHKSVCTMAEGNAERKEVEDYLRRHNLQGVMNDILNAIIKERAEFPLDAISHRLRDLDTRGIIQVIGREVLDESGRPTVCVDVRTARGVFTATVPRATPSEWGAKELKDGDEERYAGGGVTMAVKMVCSCGGLLFVTFAASDAVPCADKRANLACVDWYECWRSKGG